MQTRGVWSHCYPFTKLRLSLLLQSLRLRLCLPWSCHSVLIGEKCLKTLALRAHFSPNSTSGCLIFPLLISHFLQASPETWKNALPFKPAPPLALNPTSGTKPPLCVRWPLEWCGDVGNECLHICGGEGGGWENRMGNWIWNKQAHYPNSRHQNMKLKSIGYVSLSSVIYCKSDKGRGR